MKSTLHLVAAALSAALLGWLELLVGKALLPQLGGTPAVWNTCLVFFQGAVLLGYAASHLALRLPRRALLLAYLATLAASLLLLPPEVRGADSDVNAGAFAMAAHVLGVLARSVGPVALVLSLSTPLLTASLAGLPGGAGGNAFRLYAASNAGTFVGLLLPPLVLDAQWALPAQGHAWAALFVGFGACAAVALAWGRREASVHAAEEGPAVALPWQKLRWFLLAFVPVSLLHGVTTSVTTDVAAVPLLWVVPLVLYLGGYALAFVPDAPRPSQRTVRALVVLLACAGMLALVVPPLPTAVLLATHLLAFAGVAFTLHRMLADERPDVSAASGYFLIIAAGGLAGGAFNALLAPTLFRSTLEYSGMLAVAALLLLEPRTGPVRAGLAVQFSLGVGLAVLLFGVSFSGVLPSLAGTGALLAVGWAAWRAFGPAPVRAVATALVLLGVGQFALVSAGQPTRVVRSFFGVHRTVTDTRRGWVSYVHGTTVHGREWLEEARADEPLSYFHRSGPVGSLFRALAQRGPLSVCVTGLGIGSLAAYAREGDAWTFYELDPAVLSLARDEGAFRYLARAKGKVTVELGDGRLLLAAAKAASFEVLIADAFSSDAVPVHLLTREAFALYARATTAQGVVLLNVTNRFLDLESTVAAAAAANGMEGVIGEDLGVLPTSPDGRTRSRWIALHKVGAPQLALDFDPRFRPLRAATQPPWTDAHADVLSAMRWAP